MGNDTGMHQEQAHTYGNAFVHTDTQTLCIHRSVNTARGWRSDCGDPGTMR